MNEYVTNLCDLLSQVPTAMQLVADLRERGIAESGNLFVEMEYYDND